MDNFNPRSPHGERPETAFSARGLRDFNPRSPHGERPDRGKQLEFSDYISIHAPRMGSDDAG